MARDTEPSGKTPQDGDRPDDETGKTTTGAAAPGGEGAASDGFAQLRAHHQTLRALLGETAGLGDADQADSLLRRLAAAWARHAEAHGRLYEAGAEAGLQEFAPLTETAIRTDLVSFLLRAGRDLDGPLALAAARVAARMIGEIIDGEDKPRSGLLAKAKAAGVDPAALGRQIGAGPTRSSGDADDRTMPRLRHLTADQEDNMPRNSNMPERDEYGRFVSDDDRGGRGRGASHGYDDRERDSRGRFMSDRDDDRGRSRGGRDDDRGYGRSARGYDDDRERDSRGRFMSDHDDDRGYARSARGYDDDRRTASRRYEDDDRSDARDRGHGGWFGDAQGHAEAARRGWDHRRDENDDRDYGRGRSSRRDDDDDDRRYARGRDDDRERDSRGRFTSGRDDDDRRGYGRGRDEDERGGASRDRGQGGWFGDSRGHAEAARRGWDTRRDEDDDRDYGRGRASRRDDDEDGRRYARGRH